MRANAPAQLRAAEPSARADAESGTHSPRAEPDAVRAVRCDASAAGAAYDAERLRHEHHCVTDRASLGRRRESTLEQERDRPSLRLHLHLCRVVSATVRLPCIVPAQQIDSEVILEVAPHRVDVVRAVL